MKKSIKEVVRGISPSILGVSSIVFDYFKKLGVGEGNLNYVFSVIEPLRTTLRLCP